MKKSIPYILLILLLVRSATVSGQVSNQIELGARPLGMGGAFTAVANDANALFWNPAGLVTLQRTEFTTMYSDLYADLGLGNSYVGGVVPIGDNHAFGVDWMHIGQDDEGLSFRQDVFNLAYSLRLPWWNLSIGPKIKRVDMDISLNGASAAKTSGFEFDLGVLFSPVPGLRIGIVGQDLGTTSLSHENDRSEEIFPQKIRFGAAYSLFEGFLLAAAVDDRIRFGAEYWLFNSLAFRGGYQKDIDAVSGFNSSNFYSAGFSAKYKLIQFDYAIEDHPLLPVTHRFGIAFTFNPALVSIRDATIRPTPLFRSLYRKYSEEEFAQVVLKNSSAEQLPIRVRIDIPTVTSQPYEQDLVLDPQTTKAYPLNISLSNEILEARGASYDNLVQPIMTISYEQDRNTRETSQNMDPLYVLGKNKISWSDPGRAAAFITPEDEMVNRFARTIIQQYNDVLVDQYDNSNLGRATVLFNALGKHGIVYQADQQTPWYLIAADSSIFDNIQYPIELLNSKIGDCDDCTMLYASLLENLNIDTILLDVDAPGAGHIYLMFDSGIPLNEIDSHPIDRSEYVVYEDRVWIPVETTMYGHSFAAAWRNGADEYHLRKEQGYVHEIIVSEAIQKYRAGQPPVREIAIPTRESADELVNIDTEAYDTRIQEFALAGSISMDDPDGVYDAGAAY